MAGYLWRIVEGRREGQVTLDVKQLCALKFYNNYGKALFHNLRSSLPLTWTTFYIQIKSNLILSSFPTQSQKACGVTNLFSLLLRRKAYDPAQGSYCPGSPSGSPSPSHFSLTRHCPHPIGLMAIFSIPLLQSALPTHRHFLPKHQPLCFREYPFLTYPLVSHFPTST